MFIYLFIYLLFFFFFFLFNDRVAFLTVLLTKVGRTIPKLITQLTNQYQQIRGCISQFIVCKTGIPAFIA